MKQLFFFLILISLVSCSKIDLSDLENNEDHTGKVQVSFSVSGIEHIPFDNTQTRSSQLNSLCSRISFVIFQSGTKIKTIHQSSDDKTFGTLDIYLTPGDYQILALAHNGKGNATITSTDKITFPNNKCTDTFYTLEDFSVSEKASHPLELTRAVAMFRMCITTPIPSEVTQMQFYYTGGSSTFNAETGFGCVNSRQTETFTVSEEDHEQESRFEIYTFPHATSDNLNITVSALDTSGTTLYQTKLEDIYIEQNIITQHTEAFFNTEEDPATPDSTSSQLSISIRNNGEWADIINQ